ncbi:metal-dependent hydrolase, partial [Acinetobacter baumannii]|nr:metal-dependent hydrolase [Acinetobacter baumannii]
MMKLLSFLKNKALGSSIDYKILPRKVKFDWKNTPVV